MRRLAVPFMVIGLAWATAVGAAARQDELQVVSSEVSGGNELADLFPISVGEQPLAVTTWSGTEWVARLDPEVADEAAMITATESLAAAGGATLDDVEVASASIDLGQDGEVSISAMRVPGSRAYDLVDAAVRALCPPATDPIAGWGWAGDLWISYHLDRAEPDAGRRVTYPAADVVWIIDAPAGDDSPTAVHVEPIVEALPPQSGAIGPIVALSRQVEAPALGIAASFPADWAVEIPPMSADEQAVIDRSVARYGIDAEWKGSIRAVGPVDPALGEAPRCNLMVFGETELMPRAWIEAVTEGNRCYLIDEAPAGLVRARIHPGDCGRSWAPSQGGIEHFALGRDGDIVYLNCFSKDPPGERGSAIADSIELLPAE